MVRARARIAVEHPEQDAAQRDLVPVVQPVGLALAALEPGVEVFARLAVAHGLEPREVVEPARAGVEPVDRQVQEVGHLRHAVEDAVAESDDAYGGEPALGLAQLGERVGVVEEPGFGAVRLHRPGHVQGRLHVAEGVEEASRTSVLSVDLPRAELAGDVEVLRPVEVAAELDGHHDRAGAGERPVEIGRGGDQDPPAEPIRHRLGVRPRAGQLRRIDVDEDDAQAAVAERVAEQQVADGGGPELAAPRADEDDLEAVVHDAVLGTVTRITLPCVRAISPVCARL